MRCFRIKGVAACLILSLFALGGCKSSVPPEPTVAVLATMMPTLTPPSPTPTRPRPRSTLPPTWTPDPTASPLPTVTLPPTMTPLPPTATPDSGAVPPTAISDSGRAFDLLLTEAQVNAALAQHFDANPLPGYAIAPRVTLGGGYLLLNMQIVPQSASAGSSSLGVTLRVEFNLFGGMLETFPTELIPLDNGIATRQVKIGEALLLQTLQDVVAQAVNNTQVFYGSATVQPDGIALHLVKAGD